MTEEELEMEAREKYHNYKIEDFQGFYPRNYYCLGYIESAEPREKRIAELELKIKHLTEHLEPQAMTSLFEQVEEEVKQEQKVKELAKAKDFLRMIIDSHNHKERFSFEKDLMKAEQFLKECK